MEDNPCLLSPLEIGGGKVAWLPDPSGRESFAHDTRAIPSSRGAGSPGSAASAAIPLFQRALLSLPPVKSYADAQLDDTQRLPRGSLRWKPPLRFSVRARTSLTAPAGTFGFGLWNDPFSLSVGMGGAAHKLPAAPQCAWFFYGSPPLDLPLADGVPGSGWKAATLRFRSLPPWLLAPVALGGMALASLPPARRWAFAQARRFYRAEERLLPVDPAEWHTYAIEWSPSSAGFFVDNVEMLRSAHPPLPPLGLVLWIDNQYAVATAEKGFGFGVLALAQAQTLELEAAQIELGIPA
jgi:hypothetical protein